MTHTAIHIEGIAKRYRIGQGARRNYTTLRDRISGSMQGIMHRLSRQSATTAREASESDSHVWALRDISFEVQQGDVVGIVGHNGAGKSTLLKILSRITEPTAGRIEIYGRVGSLLEVGTGFHPELTGRENIYLNGAILGMRREEINRKFDEIVSFAEVEKFIDTPVKFYSSGMYVRLAFAVSAHLEPEILIVDEVLAVGDARFQRKCLGKMGDVAREGRTVLFVSHNMATIANLCRKAVLLRAGTMVDVGPVDHIIERYLAEISDLIVSPLAKRTDRKGRNEIVASAIDFLDDRGNLTQYPISGRALTLRVHYHSRMARQFQNCVVTVALLKNERPFFLVSTDLVDTRQLDLEGNGSIDFVIPDLPLSSGTYSLTVSLHSNGELQDFVAHAAEMTVVDGDFFGTGKSMLMGWHGQVVLVRHHWQHSVGPDPK